MAAQSMPGLDSIPAHTTTLPVTLRVYERAETRVDEAGKPSPARDSPGRSRTLASSKLSIDVIERPICIFAESSRGDSNENVTAGPRKKCVASQRAPETSSPAQGTGRARCDN